MTSPNFLADLAAKRAAHNRFTGAAVTSFGDLDTPTPATRALLAQYADSNPGEPDDAGTSEQFLGEERVMVCFTTLTFSDAVESEGWGREEPTITTRIDERIAVQLTGFWFVKAPGCILPLSCADADDVALWGEEIALEVGNDTGLDVEVVA